MAEFLTTNKTVSSIEDVIKTAKGRIVIVSPFLKISQNFFERLLYADGQGIKTTILYGKKELENDTRQQLKRLKNLSVRFYENLHAKCYLNESCIVLSSMNFHEASEKNREFGILIRKDKEEDKQIFQDVIREIKEIHEASVKVNSLAEQRAESSSARGGDGHCIRCGSAIPLDIETPYAAYCPRCFSEWRKHGQNPYFKEKVCHLCGGAWQTSKARPFCRNCYDRIRPPEQPQSVLDVIGDALNSLFKPS